MNFKINLRKSILGIINTSLVMLSLGIILSSCNQKVSITPPDALPPNGYIFISSNPEGFDIYLDGKQRRRATPDSLTWLDTGTYQITLKKDLFRDTSFTVNIVEGKKKSIFIDISKNPLMLGSIICDSQPEGAEIFMNDNYTGENTPATLKGIIPGSYEIRYHLKNYQDDSVRIAVSSGQSTTAAKLILADTTLWHYYTIKNSGILTNNLTCLSIDKNNVLWIGTDSSGVISFDGSRWGGKQIFTILPSKHVNYIAINNNNVIFICTDRGFVRYDGVSSHSYGVKTSGLPDFRVQSIGFDDLGTWYIATLGGLTKSINGDSWFTYDSYQIPDNWITSVFKDNSGIMWIGTHSYGLAKYTNNHWAFINNLSKNIINNYVRAFAESPSGEIWVGFGKLSGSGGGLSYLNNNVWQNVYVLPPSSQTNAIFIDKNNVKWVATDNGLVRFTNSADVTVFNYDNTGLNINDVTGVVQDEKGNIWISTNGGGLVEYKGNH